jgi:hypothetical protein
MVNRQTAAQTVRYDQSRAAACTAVNELVGILQSLVAESGEDQALVAVGKMLPANPAELAGLLTAALHLLRAERNGGAPVGGPAGQ